MIGKTWKRTYDVHGHSSLFKIKCLHCKTKMVLRHSNCIPYKHLPLFGEGNAVNIASYKCQNCASVQRFFIIDERAYLESVVKDYRRGNQYFIPTKEEWSREDTEIARQLQVLGYFGGR